jgi:hypothetical protein
MQARSSEGAPLPTRHPKLGPAAGATCDIKPRTAAPRSGRASKCTPTWQASESAPPRRPTPFFCAPFALRERAPFRSHRNAFHLSGTVRPILLRGSLQPDCGGLCVAPQGRPAGLRPYRLPPPRPARHRRCDAGAALRPLRARDGHHAARRRRCVQWERRRRTDALESAQPSREERAPQVRWCASGREAPASCTVRARPREAAERRADAFWPHPARRHAVAPLSLALRRCAFARRPHHSRRKPAARRSAPRRVCGACKRHKGDLPSRRAHAPICRPRRTPRRACTASRCVACRRRSARPARRKASTLPSSPRLPPPCRSCCTRQRTRCDAMRSHAEPHGTRSCANSPNARRSAAASRLRLSSIRTSTARCAVLRLPRALCPALIVPLARRAGLGTCCCLALRLRCCMAFVSLAPLRRCWATASTATPWCWTRTRTVWCRGHGSASQGLKTTAGLRWQPRCRPRTRLLTGKAPRPRTGRWRTWLCTSATCEASRGTPTAVRCRLLVADACVPC